MFKRALALILALILAIQAAAVFAAADPRGWSGAPTNGQQIDFVLVKNGQDYRAHFVTVISDIDIIVTFPEEDGYYERDSGDIAVGDQVTITAGTKAIFEEVAVMEFVSAAGSIVNITAEY